MRKLIKYLTILCIPTLNAGDYRVKVNTDRKGWAPHNLTKIQEELNTEKATKRKDQIEILSRSKNHLLNGELFKASFLLDKLREDITPLTPIKKRLKAIIYFVKGDYELALNQLNDKVFDNFTQYKHICTLKTLLLMYQGPSHKLNREFKRCYDETNDYSTSNQLWFESTKLLVDKNTRALKGHIISEISYLLSSLEMTRIWLTMALYLNKEKLVDYHLSTIPEEYYKSHKIRELLGLVYYRMGQYDKSQQFISDLNTPMANIIKGNSSLLKKDYEIAMGYFKLALRDKQNSINALERVIPLSWIIKSWQDGQDALTILSSDRISTKHIYALRSAFYIRQDKFKMSERTLRVLQKEFLGFNPNITNLMNAYTSLRLNNFEDMDKYSFKACQRNNPINCWVQYKLLHFTDLGKTIERDDSVIDNELDLESFIDEIDTTALEEEVILDQKDIEEMDDDLVKIK